MVSQLFSGVFLYEGLTTRLSWCSCLVDAESPDPSTPRQGNTCLSELVPWLGVWSTPICRIPKGPNIFFVAAGRESRFMHPYHYKMILYRKMRSQLKTEFFSVRHRALTKHNNNIMKAVVTRCGQRELKHKFEIFGGQK